MTKQIQTIQDISEHILKATGPDHDRTGCLYGCGEMGSCHPNLSLSARKLALHILGLNDCKHTDEKTKRYTCINVYTSGSSYSVHRGPFTCTKKCPHRGLQHVHEMTVRTECLKCHKVVVREKTRTMKGAYALRP